MVVIRAEIADQPGVEIRGYADGHAKIVTLSQTASFAASSSLAPVSGKESGDADDDAFFHARLAAVQADGLEAVSDLASRGNLPLEMLRRDLALPEVTSLAVQVLDYDNDGLVTNDDVLMLSDALHAADNGTLPPALRILRDYLGDSIETLDLDEPGGEPVAIPVEFLARWAQYEAELALSYDLACELTMSYVDYANTARGLCAKLMAAHDAASRGQFQARDNMLQAYRNELRAQSGRSITPQRAATLATVSWMLQSAGE